MTDAELTAMIWALIAEGHSDTAILELLQAQSNYVRFPTERRKILLQVIMLATALTTHAAEDAKRQFNAQSYEAVKSHAHEAYQFLVQVREAVRLSDDDSDPSAYS